MKEQREQQLPKSRDEDLACQELPDEMLVYDLKNHKAHCLNPTASQIWKACDGKTTVPEISKRLAQELNAPISEDVVWLALDQLGKSRLLEKRVVPPTGIERVTRRQAMRRLGLVVTLPLVTSIIAPTAVHAATCIGGKKNDKCSAAECGQLCASCKGKNYCNRDGNSSNYSCGDAQAACP